MLLPAPAGTLPSVTFLVDANAPTILELEVRSSSVPGGFTPDYVMHRETLQLKPGERQPVSIRPAKSLPRAAYVTYSLLRNSAVRVHTTAFRATGILSLSQSMNKAVAKGARQEPPEGSGIDSFEFWLPTRRPEGRNLAIILDPPLDLFGPDNAQNGVARPTTQPNAWVADPADPQPWLSLCWGTPRAIRRIELSFDTDFDHPMESVLMGHPEREIPFCVDRYRITADHGQVLHECAGNHQTRNLIVLPESVTTSAIHIEVLKTHGAPAAIFEVRCYED
jgi:hypothetical protein